MKYMIIMKRILAIFAICFSITLLSGCSSILSLWDEEEPEQVSALKADSIIVGAEEIRTQTIKLINSATKAVYVQLSSLDDPDIINLLVNKSQSGIEVRILLDQWQRENSATVKTLKNQNISVQYYPAQKGQYQRVRYMVTDYQTAVFYSQDWTSKGFKTHSMAIKLAGDTAWNIAKSFDKDWTYTTTLGLKLPEITDLPEDNIIFSQNSGVKQQVLGAINSATSEIIIIVEQLSDPDTVAAIVNAKNRGCTVKLIVSPSTAVATPNTIKKFLETQIEIKYFSNPDNLPIGYNLGIFDKKTLVMTSSSWTYYSFVINHEAALVIPSPAVAERIDKLFQEQWNISKSI